MFRKYDDVERLGKEEVEGILNGTCYIFEKIDGANISIYWNEEKGLVINSRNTQVFSEKTGGGFRGVEKYVLEATNIKEMAKKYPNFIFYGEWLVKHTVQYPSGICNKLYLFDIYNRDTDSYLTYTDSSTVFTYYKVDYISPLAILSNPKEEDLKQYLSINNFKATPLQEGIVIKNYSFRNRFGRMQWAKIVNQPFKEVNKEVFSYSSNCCKAGTFQNEGKHFCSKCSKECIPTRIKNFEGKEQEIVESYITSARVEKICKKIVDLNTIKHPVSYSDFEIDEYKISEKNIPQILEMTWYDLLTEDIHDIIKKYKLPTIDFKKFKKYSNDRIKTILFSSILK